MITVVGMIKLSGYNLMVMDTEWKYAKLSAGIAPKVAQIRQPLVCKRQTC